jgi:hypothetical protein
VGIGPKPKPACDGCRHKWQPNQQLSEENNPVGQPLCLINLPLILSVSPPLHEGHTTADPTLRTTAAVAGGIVRRGVVLNAALFLRKCSSIHSVCHRTVESIWASNRFF